MIIRQKTTSFVKGMKTENSIFLTSYADNGKTEMCVVNIYPELEYQTFDFFGGAVTEAVGTVLSSVSPETAAKVIRDVFSPEGLGYRSVRTHIDSCDFSTGQYCAMNDPDDTSLSSFSIARDERTIIPWIKAACEAAGFSIPVLLTPWTPPAFMKTNASRTGGGHLKPEYYALWADYICRYIIEYRCRDVNVRMLSVQNEPNAVQPWDSCIFSAEEEGRFVSDFLYPALVREGLSDVGIYIWDHNKERAYERVRDTVTSGNEEKIEGVAFHWYTGDHFDALRLIREKYPSKKLIFTESCIEYSRYDGNQLKNARRYAHDMTGNFAAGMNASYDWNICLDSSGGPNYVGNYCDAPVMINADGSIRHNLSYDYIGHFSRYLKPGAKRVATTQYSESFDQVAFRNPDGTTVLILLNKTDEEMEIAVRMDGMIIPAKLAPDSISTMTVNA